MFGADRKQLNCAESSASVEAEQEEGRKRRDRYRFYYAQFGQYLSI